MKTNTKKILVSGSIAYDRIMDFPGFFKDHILPEQTHILNVSFTLGRTEESFGGTGGNIAYNLALLKQPVTLLGVVGGDFLSYQKWLSKNKVDISQIKIFKNEPSTSAYIMTDKADNQISGFYPGPTDYKNCAVVKKIKSPFLAIVSPDYKARMISYIKFYKQMDLDYIFDPGQQITSFSATDLKKCIKGSKALMGNDYEIKMILQKLAIDLSALQKLTDILVITKGANGSEIYQANKKINIKPVKVNKIIDPTGAGDAYRAGFIKGLALGLDLRQSGQLASTIAAYAVEQKGTQKHRFNLKDFLNRYKKNYKEIL